MGTPPSPTHPALPMKTIAALTLCLLLGSAVAQEEPEEMTSLADADGMMMEMDPEDGMMMMDPEMMEMMDGMMYDPESEMYIDADGMVMPMTAEMMAMMDDMTAMTGMEGMMTDMEGAMPEMTDEE